jgi:hypothetical protein
MDNPIAADAALIVEIMERRGAQFVAYIALAWASGGRDRAAHEAKLAEADVRMVERAARDVDAAVAATSSPQGAQ